MPEKNTTRLGSLFMIGIPGTQLDDSTVELVRDKGIHNFILFKRNVADREQLQALCTALKDLCRQNNLPAPLISIDQEGGSVTRLPPPFTQFPHQRTIASGRDCQAGLQAYARTCAQELREIGINMNLAPVLDICPAGAGFFMEQRCLGADPQQVAELGALVIREMQAGGIAACAKHFPGLGQAVLDPHLVLPVVSAERRDMTANDLIPFHAARMAGVAAFMTSHTIYEKIDPQWPATMSATILKEILRGDIDFQGLVITDDLEMGAIEENDVIENAAMAAFIAGADMLLICHRHEKVVRSLTRLQEAMNDHFLPPGTVELALERQEKVRRQFA